MAGSAAAHLRVAFCRQQWRQERLARNYETAKMGLAERRDVATMRLHFLQLFPLVREALELEAAVRAFDQQLAELDDDARFLGIIEVPTP